MKFWEKIIFLHIFILGLAFTFLPPPLQKPDEHGHFKRAFYLSEGYIYLWNDGKKLPVDRQIDDLINDIKLNSLPNHPERKISFPDTTKPVFAGNNAFAPVYHSEKLMFIWGPIAYIPQSIGILFARVLHLNAYLTFYAGRVSIFLLSFAVLLWLYRHTHTPYRFLLLFAFALPMTMHQLTAYSYDAVHYLLGFILFHLFTKFLMQKKITLKELVAYGATVVAFMAAKLSYEPLLLLILVIPWQKIADTKVRYLKVISVWIVAVIAFYFIITAPTYLSSLTYKGNPPGINPGRQASFILAHPIRFVETFVSSSWNLKKFHAQGVIGIFGWLDYSLDWWMYGVYLLICIYMIYRIKEPVKWRLPPANTVLLAVILFVNYAFIMTVFYLNWKTVGSPTIDGTQGRYFTVFIPFILYILLRIKSSYTIHD